MAFLGSQPGALQHLSGPEPRVHCSIFRELKLLRGAEPGAPQRLGS